MKKFELFGLSLTFKINKKNSDDAELYSENHHLIGKIYYLLFFIAIIIASSRIGDIVNNKKIGIGEVAINDIYSPKNITFNDFAKKEEIISEIVENAEKEYIHVPKAGVLYIESATNLFDKFITKKSKKNVFYINKIEETIGKPIPQDILNKLSKMKKKDIIKHKEVVINFLKNAYQVGIVREGSIIKISSPNDEIFQNLNEFDRKIANIFITPNYIYDEAKTKEKILSKVSQIGDQIVNIKAGELLVAKGEIITERKYKILEKVGIYSNRKNLFLTIANIFYTIIVATIYYPLISKRYKENILKKNTYRSIFLIFIIVFLSYRFIKPEHAYLLPFETIIFLMAILFKRDFAFTMVSMALVLLFPIIYYDPIFIMTSLLICLMSSYLLRKIRTRQELIALGLKLAITKFFIYLLLAYFSKREPNVIILESSEIIVSGLLSGMLAIAFIPYFEKTFNILTKFKLLELGDLSQPLLKLLAVKAPGTFQHSMMVATLSEAAAEAIGANAVFARVASYYHDIGKIKRPQFYVENQEGGENTHEKISPFLSSIIILSHTKDGNELGREYQIPKEIRDIMIEHQGTTLLAYFYNKAKQQDPSVIEDDFKYSGPIPSSKESAIIMLADSIEAAVRSLDEKTPRTIENMLRKIINSKIEDNQLSEAELTFKEIEIIIKTFTKTLISIHHVRIKYPNQNKNREQK